ncbi:gag-pol polyprotein [Tanacetum coccineum]
MRGTMQNKVDRETRFNNEFDQFVAETREALVSVYNRFAQLINDLERNGIIFLEVTVNIKFLNCLQPECLKKELKKSHDPLALVAHTGSSSRTTSPYYVTHPSSVVDYDDDYQGDAVQNTFEDPLTSVMILLARAITQRISNPTNNHLCTSSNTKNQAIVQGNRVNIQSRNSGTDGRITRRSYVQKEIIEGNNVKNDAGNIQRTLRTTSSGTAVNAQCYNCSEKGHYARNCPKPIVWDSKYFMEQMLLAKQDEARVILTDEHNNFLFADASRMEEIEELSANICLMAKIRPANFDSDAGPSYDYAFLSEITCTAPRTSYSIISHQAVATCHSSISQPPLQPRIIPRTCQSEGDAGAMWQHPIGQPPVMWHPRQRRSMTGQPPFNHRSTTAGPPVDGGQWRQTTGQPPLDRCRTTSQPPRTTGQRWWLTGSWASAHNNIIGDDQIDSNIIFDEPNEDVNSSSVEYDNNIQESYELEQLARNTFKEAEKQQIIAKKFSAEQKYFSSSFISSENPSNASSPSSPSETKPTVAPMPSANPMKLDLNKMENDFKRLFALLLTVGNPRITSLHYDEQEK